MKKHLLLLLTTLLGAVQTVCAQEIYAAVNNKTATIYYDDQKVARNGEDMGFGNMYGTFTDVTKVVFDASVKNYRPGSLRTWFQNWTSLTTIEHLDYLNTEEVTTMFCMFHSCTALTSLDLTSFDTEQVTDMEGMFAYCSSLTSVDLSSFKTAQVTNMNGMFAYCESLTTIYADESRWSIAGLTSTNNGMFIECMAPLTGGNGTSFWTTGYAENENYAYVDKAGQPGYLTHKAGPVEATKEPYAVYNNGTLTFYYDKQKTSRGGYDIGPFTSTSSRWGGHKSDIKTVVFDASMANCTSITNMAFWFLSCNNLTSVTGTQYLNTSNVTDMKSLFAYCYKLKSVDVSKFDTKNVTNMQSMFSQCMELETIDVSQFNTQNVTTMENMFWSCSKVKSLDVSNFNTSKVTSMLYMFCGCSLITDVDASNFDTSKVTDFKGMFLGCENLANIYCDNTWRGDVESFQMFQSCTKLPGYDNNVENSSFPAYYYAKPFAAGGVFTPASNIGKEPYVVHDNGTLTFYFDKQKESRGGIALNNCTGAESTYSDITAVVFHESFVDYLPISTNSWFSNRKSLSSISGLANLNTSAVADMSGMFEGCEKFEILDLTTFNTPHLTNVQGMFANCSGLQKVDLSNFTTTKVTNTSNMFSGCTNLTTIYVDEVTWNTNAVTSSDAMFLNCSKIKGGSGTVYDANTTDKTYARIDMDGQPGYLTQKNGSIIAEPEPYAVLSNDNTVLTFYYDDQKTARNGMDVGPFTSSWVSDINRWNVSSGWDAQRESITSVVFDASFAGCTTLTSTAYLFYGFKSLSSITGIGNLKTDNVTDMHSMFYDCSSLTSLDVTGFKTDKVTDMFDMFYGCSGLTSLDVTGFKTDNVTEMTYMFAYCSGLTSLDVTGFKTDNVTRMAGMFYRCRGLTNLDVTGLKTDNVWDMAVMFDGCRGLTSLDVTGFKTDNVTRMYGMFSGCSSLTSLDVTRFKTDNVTRMEDMFSGCSGLKTIYAGDGWSTAKVQNGGDMFKGCTSLVGGAGTTYDANYTDHTYAHIDGGTSNPGYFTQKGGPAMGSCDMSEVPTDNDFYAATSFLCERGVLDGSKVDGKYLVEKELLRQHLANITFRGLFTLKGREIPSTFVSDQYPAIYDDLKSDAPYYQAAKTLLYLDYGDHITPFDRDRDGFFPDNNESRINILKELMEAFNIKPDMEGTDNPFPNEADIAQLSETSPIKMGYVRQAAKLGIITTENEQFRPYKECLRGEAFLMLAHIIQKIEAGEIADPNPQESDFLDPNSGTGTAEPYAVYNNGTLTFYYDDNKENRGGLSVGPFGAYDTRWGGNANAITQVVFDPSFASCHNITSTARWFDDCGKLISISGLEYLNTENVTDMRYMFFDCYNLTSLNLKNFNTSKVTNMSHMFCNIQKIKNLDVTMFDTSNVTDMSNMFTTTVGLTSLDLSHFNTEKVTTMSGMFQASNVTSLDLSSFNTDKVTNMSYMFNYCSGLTSLDISTFNTEKVTSVNYMFHYCTDLTTIIVSDSWTTEAVVYGSNVFVGSKKLIGGAGTTYDSDHTDYTYARIDGGTDAPGYFTSTSAMPKVCAKPVISMKDGKLVYDCTTEGVTYKSTISKSYNSSSITLKDTYILSVYAIKDGYENSEAATVEIQLRSPGKKGDVDEDGVVDIADAVRIVNYVVGKVDALAPRHEMNLQDPE